jgi:two-component system, chemotaxis family, sensor kinase CheA
MEWPMNTRLPSRYGPRPSQVDRRHRQGPAADPTVLIIDDDAEFREALAAVVRGRGYSVEVSSNGMEALDMLRWGLVPRVILLDMQMGPMTGWEFRVEQRRDQRLSNIPVVAMTAGPWKDRDSDDFSHRIQKPLDLERLASLIDSHR